MANFLSNEEIKNKISQLGLIQPWNHNFQLPEGLETAPGAQRSHGKNLVKWQRIESLLQKIGVSGKKVLDVGTNEGYFSHQLASKGANVLGIDVDFHRIEKATFIQEVLETSNVQFKQMDIYSQEFSSLPRFDFCLCMGFLHRVPDPFTAMAQLAKICNLILFEWKVLKTGPHDEPFAYFTPGGFVEKDLYGTPYWLLSFQCVEEIMKRLGFDRFHKVDDPTQRRGILVAGRVDNPIFQQPDSIKSGKKILAFLRHTKRYVKTVGKILTGQMNA